MNERGMTVVEALVAIAILGVAMAAVMPAFVIQVHVNTDNELRSGAVAAAQQVMESLRLDDPASMPESGFTGPLTINAGSRQYEAFVRYCRRSDYCNAGSRNLVVEVYFDDRLVYSVETVFTQLR